MKIIEKPKEKIYKIKDSDNAYISKNGIIYIKYKNGYFIKKQYKTHGYMYVKLLYNKKQRSKRVHRLVAETFIPNPHNLPIVGHKNNIKTDNSISNLYWTTYQENAQKAHDDGLIINDKGYEDSQSIPIYVCDNHWNILDSFGSISECAKAYAISKSTIAKQAAHPPNMRHITKLQLYFIKQKDYKKSKRIVGYNKEKPLIAQNINTGKKQMFSSINECAKTLNISRPTISRHLKENISKNRCGYIFYFSNDYRKV